MNATTLNRKLQAKYFGSTSKVFPTSPADHDLRATVGRAELTVVPRRVHNWRLAVRKQREAGRVAEALPGKPSACAGPQEALV